jgi:hypothetical protein
MQLRPPDAFASRSTSGQRAVPIKRPCNSPALFRQSLANFGNVCDNNERAAICRRPAFGRKRTLHLPRTRDLLAAYACQAGASVPSVQAAREAFQGIAVKILHRCSLSCGCLMVALLATITTASPRLLAQPTYSIDFGSISSISGTASQNPCFQLTGEIGRPALGYSSNAPSTPTYSIYSGFWAVALTASPDDIFFTSFEAC